MVSGLACLQHFVMMDSLNMLTSCPPDIEAVIFDVYGTLVEIADKQSPYLKLLQILESRGRERAPGDAALIMGSPVGLASAAHSLAPGFVSVEELALLEQKLFAELQSVRAFPEALETLEALRRRGYRIGLCSNLAAPYAAPVAQVLSFAFDSYGWSFELGFLKPDPRIYRRVCEDLGCSPSRVLMVGDTLEADVLGPRRVGMHAIHLDRARRMETGEAIHALVDLLPVLTRR